MYDILIIVGWGILAIAISVICAMGYVKAPPDVAYIISGIRPKPRIAVGTFAIRIPFLERLDKLSLALMQVDIKTGIAIPTKEYINISVDGVANLKIKSTGDEIRKAAEMFLGRNAQELQTIMGQVLEGTIREIVGTMQLKELITDRERLADEVRSNAEGEFAKMGIEIVNFSIQSFQSEGDAIANLGVDNIVRLRQEAQIARANSEKEVAVAKAEASQLANEAEAAAKIKIAQQNTDVALKEAELKRIADIAKAQADAAYEIESNKQRKDIEVAKVDADIARTRQEGILEESKIAVQTNILTADINKKADADLYAMLKKAEGIKAVGEAEADRIAKKAEAQNKFGQAAVLEMFFQVLPQIVENAAHPLEKVEKIVMYGDGNTSRLIGDVLKITDQTIEGLEHATGMDIRTIIKSYAESKAKLDA